MLENQWGRKILQRRDSVENIEYDIELYILKFWYVSYDCSATFYNIDLIPEVNLIAYLICDHNIATKNSK